MFIQILSYIFPLLVSLLAPCQDSYTIRIPRTVDLTETRSFVIEIIRNDLSDDQLLHIDMPDTFTLSDSHGRSDISGTISGNHITCDSGDTSSHTVSLDIPSIPVGEWSGTLDISIRLEQLAVSNKLIPGEQLNDILKTIDPETVTFRSDPQPGTPHSDVSLAQDGSVLLYVSGSDVIITNESGIPVIANQDMSCAFADLSSLTSIDGFDLLDMSGCENVSSMFEDAGVTSLDLSSWDTSSITDMSSLFEGCAGLTSPDMDGWDCSEVSDMDSMFRDCSSLRSLSLQGWDVSSCLSFHAMFSGCSSMTSTGSLASWETGSCADFSSMFEACTKLRNIGSLQLWDASSATDMSHMFHGCSKLNNIGDLSDWQVGSVEDFSYMFSGASSIGSYASVSSWEVGASCTDLSCMFRNCGSALPATFDLSGWDVCNVTDMSHMFENSRSLTSLEISGWDTGNLEDASCMFGFSENTSLSPLSQIIGIDSIDTGSLRNISRIFYENQYLNADLSEWDTEQLEDISYAFYGTYRFDIDKLKHWNVSSVSDMTECFGDNAGTFISSPVPDWYH